jgi:hypothetical protein
VDNEGDEYRDADGELVLVGTSRSSESGMKKITTSGTARSSSSVDDDQAAAMNSTEDLCGGLVGSLDGLSESAGSLDGRSESAGSLDGSGGGSAGDRAPQP